MKKSFKVIMMTLTSSLILSVGQPVSAQSTSHQSLTLVNDWIQRTYNEVAYSIQNDLQYNNVYTIRWGDTLSTIAKAMRMSVAEVMALNNIDNPNHIVAGRSLYLTQQVDAPQTEISGTESNERSLLVDTASFNQNPTETEEATVAEQPTYVEETTVEETTEVTTEIAETIPEVVTELTQEPVTTVEVVETESLWQEETTEVSTVDTSATQNLSAREAFDQLAAQKGLSASEIEGWAYIIQRESGWNHTISNPTSGAYGLPQALPGNKMASHGEDWATNPYTQLAWMYDYMVNRYGSVQGAIDFWHANHWY
ncbi:hypothetical protein CYJ57_07060 [Falseniella ignava]|uniref:LysM domain-containing protein n=1 Tax=Falseniella ignava TaxID=137730 RepID=A0A2I1JW16_9LACT|nr:LysM peptidoglycan-binding domain-containing protein [Falseniella ignava]PKY87566.1 hypothetical protein CYJ57_07060 [Falseniella ignava]